MFADDYAFNASSEAEEGYAGIGQGPGEVYENDAEDNLVNI